MSETLGAQRGYIDLKVWSKGMDLVVLVYALGKQMPPGERYGMTSQMQRAAASAPANIAEGYQRGTRKDYAHFISIARGSLAETETFLMLTERTGMLTAEQTGPALALAAEISRMLARLRERLSSPLAPRP